MAAPKLSEIINSHADPMLSFKWAAKSHTLPFGLHSTFLESVDLPFNNIGVGETIYTGGGYDVYPGSHTISSVNLVFYEDQLGTCLKWIELWKSKVKNFRNGIYNLPGDGGLNSGGYKQQIDLQMLNTRDERILDVSLIGLWPEATSNWSLNYTDNGRLTISQAFSIDDQIITY